jgi:GNAT superfamily N-acetyltransferase
MTTRDVAPAAAMLRRGDWGDREGFFAWAVDHPACRPYVADDDGRLVATGVATANGTVGWVGTIFVDAERRGSGLGAALTRTVVDDLEGRGCRTLVLIATTAGRPIYERQGFEVLEQQVHLSIGGLPEGPDPAAVRRFEPPDLPGILALDATATGEDRSAILSGLVAPETTRVATGRGGHVEGFVVRASWGGAALIAADPAAALRLFEWRRRRAGPDGRVAVGLMASNETGQRLLRAAGWTEHGGAVRMIRGDPLVWRPDWLWGQFNGALG